MIVVLVNQHRFPCAGGGGTATRVPHKDRALTSTLSEYSAGSLAASATTGVHSHDHAKKRSRKEIVSSFGSPSQLVDAELAQMSPLQGDRPLISSKPLFGTVSG